MRVATHHLSVDAVHDIGNRKLAALCGDLRVEDDLKEQVAKFVAMGTAIGFDPVQDKRLYHVTSTGIVVVEGDRSPVDISAVVV